MKIVLAQLNSVNNIEDNFSAIEKTILDFKKIQPMDRPRLIVFPENSLFFRIDENEKIQALGSEHKIFKSLEKLSAELNIYFHLTTAMHDQNKIWNASVLISPNKKTEIIYKKIHLFDIALDGQRPIRESDVFSHGEKSAVFEIDRIKFGSSICYDLRFSELYSQYAKSEVDVILVPAAFLVKTGMAHWEILLRARAIESQAFVLAPAQAGKHHSTTSEQFRETFGHSLAVNPWGEVIAVKPDGVGLLSIDIDSDKCRQVRGQIPMRNHRRLF